MKIRIMRNYSGGYRYYVEYLSAKDNELTIWWRVLDSKADTLWGARQIARKFCKQQREPEVVEGFECKNVKE